jgi:hypothetical protein
MRADEVIAQGSRINAAGIAAGHVVVAIEPGARLAAAAIQVFAHQPEHAAQRGLHGAARIASLPPVNPTMLGFAKHHEIRGVIIQSVAIEVMHIF